MKYLKLPACAIAIAIFCATLAAAQTITATWSCVPATVVVPGTLTCTLTQTGGSTASTGPAGYSGSFSITPTPGAQMPTFTTIGTALSAGLFAQSSGNTFTLDWLNSLVTPNTLTSGTGAADGAIATATISIPGGVTCSGNSPCLTVTSPNLIATSITGSPMSVTVIPSTPVSIKGSYCDINGDGQVNVADVVQELGYVLSKNAAGERMAGESAPSVVDIQIVINAVLGKGCIATQ
jgi:hypothetical protein